MPMPPLDQSAIRRALLALALWWPTGLAHAQAEGTASTTSEAAIPPAPTTTWEDEELPTAPVDDDDEETPARRLFVPARRPGGIDLEATASLFLVLSESGFGGTVSGRATYHGTGHPYYLRLTLLESGASRRVDAFGRESVAGTAGGWIGGGYDGSVFGFGVGVGVARLLPLYLHHYDDRITYSSARATVLGAFELRMGSLDGIHLGLAMGIVRADGGAQFGYADALLQVPVTPRVRILAHALFAQSALGPAMLDLSIKARIRGDGQHGTIFLVGGLGWESLARASTSFGDGLFFDRSAEDAAGGPALRVGIEARP